MERGDVRAYSTHRTRCTARFVTYSASTDSYVGNDGRLKRCRL
ncbi:BA14K family protein [Devosia sp. Root413D1]|nr:BA14K family protein [Devosia sp. Root413D1]